MSGTRDFCVIGGGIVGLATALTLLKVNDDFAQGIPANGPIPSGLLGYDSSAPAYVQDLDKAKVRKAIEVAKQPQPQR